jgi:hypothetical protein
VDRSTTGSNSADPGGQSVDGRAARRTRRDVLDELKHLAKVRVAGSNPVFRSILAGQKRFLNHKSTGLRHERRVGREILCHLRITFLRVPESREPIRSSCCTAPGG